jgi:hypothetical protein
MVDIPFVSEDFQRAFRNQFPSQTSTGRDLHVSDVVIPVVDMSPVASGASLPLDLRFCRNRNTTSVNTSTTIGFTDIITTTGFWGVNINISGYGGQTIIEHQLNGGGTTTSISKINVQQTTGDAFIQLESFVVFVKPGDALQYAYTENGTNGTFAGYYTQLADVNGNLISPNGYSPQ